MKIDYSERMVALGVGWSCNKDRTTRYHSCSMIKMRALLSSIVERNFVKVKISTLV